MQCHSCQLRVMPLNAGGGSSTPARVNGPVSIRSVFSIVLFLSPQLLVLMMLQSSFSPWGFWPMWCGSCSSCSGDFALWLLGWGKLVTLLWLMHLHQLGCFPNWGVRWTLQSWCAFHIRNVILFMVKNGIIGPSISDRLVGTQLLFWQAARWVQLMCYTTLGEQWWRFSTSHHFPAEHWHSGREMSSLSEAELFRCSDRSASKTQVTYIRLCWWRYKTICYLAFQNHCLCWGGCEMRNLGDQASGGSPGYCWPWGTCLRSDAIPSYN